MRKSLKTLAFVGLLAAVAVGYMKFDPRERQGQDAFAVREEPDNLTEKVTRVQSGSYGRNDQGKETQKIDSFSSAGANTEDTRKEQADPQARVSGQLKDTTGQTIPAQEQPQNGILLVNGVYEDPQERQKFLTKKEMTTAGTWESYESFTNDKFEENSLLGKFSGELDDGKGTIEIDLNGQFVDEKFVGKISILLKDPAGSILTNSESDSGNLGNVVRYDPQHRALLIRVHRTSRYVFQIFGNDSKDSLLGNVYEDHPSRGFRIFGRFLSHRI